VDEPTLHRFTEAVSAALRVQLVEGVEATQGRQEPVVRADGAPIPLDVVEDLMPVVADLATQPAWVADRAAIDRWLAPRLHYALRLTRAQAADRNLWAWLAVRHHTFVTWRWQDGKGQVAEDRWNGPVHKQALMRLWWGAELFRDGADYGPAERAFVRQDFPNSYLHRPVVRCRSLALALVDVVAPTDGTARSPAEINDLARVLNLVTAGCPPELATDLQQDDHAAFDAWNVEKPSVPGDWDKTPTGPGALDTTDASRDGGRVVAERCWVYAAGHPQG
jgi:hypothetical protein